MGKNTNISNIKSRSRMGSYEQYKSNLVPKGRYSNLSNIRVGERTLPKEQVVHNFRQVDINKLQYSSHEKDIYMFGGNTTTSDLSSNGNVKVNEALLTPKNREKTNLYSISYRAEPFKIKGLPEKEYETEVLTLFEKLFKPNLYDEKGYIKKKQGIEKVFKNLILESHCGGAYFANIIIDCFYDILEKEFGKSEAVNLIRKIQYLTYAPCELPRHEVNCFVIAPFADMEFTWKLMLDAAEDKKLATDYPKGITQKLLRARDRGTISEVFDETFKESRAIVSKIGQTTFFVPDVMNPNLSIGDHSIDCISKDNILYSETDFSKTAQLANYAASTALNSFESDSYIDSKDIYNNIVEQVRKILPAKLKSPLDD